VRRSFHWVVAWVLEPLAVLVLAFGLTDLASSFPLWVLAPMALGALLVVVLIVERTGPTSRPRRSEAEAEAGLVTRVACGETRPRDRLARPSDPQWVRALEAGRAWGEGSWTAADLWRSDSSRARTALAA
jgi:hypothetical protein